MFATTDIDVPTTSVTTMTSSPVILPKVIGSWKPRMTGARKFVQEDDPNSSDYTDTLTGVPNGKAFKGNVED